jgi:hypothetical protein
MTLALMRSVKPEPDLPPEYDPRNDVQGVSLLLHCTMSPIIKTSRCFPITMAVMT